MHVSAAVPKLRPRHGPMEAVPGTTTHNARADLGPPRCRASSRQAATRPATLPCRRRATQPCARYATAPRSLAPTTSRRHAADLAPTSSPRPPLQISSSWGAEGAPSKVDGGGVAGVEEGEGGGGWRQQCITASRERSRGDATDRGARCRGDAAGEQVVASGGLWTGVRAAAWGLRSQEVSFISRVCLNPTLIKAYNISNS